MTRRNLPTIEKLGLHDRYQLEVKLDYPSTPGGAHRTYLSEFYLFLAQNMQVGPERYGTHKFYNDGRHFLRLSSPHASLDELYDGTPDESPLAALEAALHARHTTSAGDLARAVENETKLFASTLREAAWRTLRFAQDRVARDAELD